MNQYDMNIENSRSVTEVNNVNQNPYINQNQNAVNNNNNNANTNLNNNAANSLIPGGFSQSDFIKGALLGAAVTYLLTNKNAQEKVMGAASKASELFQAGMEEAKERYEDVKAQMEANKNQ